MKSAIIFILLFSIFSCKKTENEKSIGFIHENYFAVSENDRKLGSVNNIITKDSNRLELIINEDARFNDDYLIGGIHFMIEDSLKSFYLINYLEPLTLMCGNVDPLSKSDSIFIVKKNIELIKKSKPISTKSIQEILFLNRKSITENKSNRPLFITFAMKDDTLKGKTMFNIVNFMESNKMFLYIIRRMNKEELEKTGK